MGTGLINLENLGGGLAVQRDDDFDALTAGGFNGRLRLFSKGEFIDKNLISPGSFGIARDGEIEIDLGNSIDVLPLARRAQSEDWTNKSQPLVSYNMASPLFSATMATAAVKMDENPCRFGINYLLFERSTGRFMEYYVTGARSLPEVKLIHAYLPLTQADIDAKREAGHDDDKKLKPRQPQAVTMKTRMKGAKFPSYVPVVQLCSTPFTSLPTSAVREVNAFINAKDTEVELAGDETDKRAR